MKVKIKDSHLKTVVAFNSDGKTPLGERKDLDKLAVIALESGDKSLLELFEEIPPLDELKADKVEKELPALPAAKK